MPQAPALQQGTVVGIDPGQEGGIVALDLLGQLVGHQAADVDGYYAGKLLSARRVRDFLLSLPGPILSVVVESQGVRPQQGAVSGLTTGKGWGILLGVVEGMGLPLHEVTPAKWATALHGQGCKDAAERKARTVRLVEREIPNLPLTWGRRTKPHDGLSDAGGIALYGRLRLLRG